MRLVLLAALLAVLGGGHGLPAPLASAPCREMGVPIRSPAPASTPYIVLRAGGRTGPWLLDFGSTLTSVYAGSLLATASVGPAVAFPVPGGDGEARPRPVIAGGHRRPGLGEPVGLLGTDVLKDTTTELHFEDASNPHVLFRDPSCALRPLGREGFVRFGQADRFSSRPETHGSGLPNVPVVAIELEERPTDPPSSDPVSPKRSARTWAQLDTGYADTVWPHSVDINEPYLARLRETVPLVPVGLVRVSGCGREDSLREVFVAPGWTLQVVPDIPQKPIAIDDVHLIVKPRTTGCGGIGPMPVPAAQLGASFLKAFGTTVLVPSRSELWIRLPGLN